MAIVPKVRVLPNIFDIIDIYELDQVDTLALLPVATSLTVPQKYQVTADGTATNNGEYILLGTAGNAGTGWEKVSASGGTDSINGGTA